MVLVPDGGLQNVKEGIEKCWAIWGVGSGVRVLPAQVQSGAGPWILIVEQKNPKDNGTIPTEVWEKMTWSKKIAYYCSYSSVMTAESIVSYLITQEFSHVPFLKKLF